MKEPVTANDSMVTLPLSSYFFPVDFQYTFLTVTQQND